MANDVYVSFGADTTGLEASFALLKAQIRATSAEVGKLAKEMNATGANAESSLGRALREQVTHLDALKAKAAETSSAISSSLGFSGDGASKAASEIQEVERALGNLGSTAIRGGGIGGGIQSLIGGLSEYGPALAGIAAAGAVAYAALERLLDAQQKYKEGLDAVQAAQVRANDGSISEKELKSLEEALVKTGQVSTEEAFKIVASFVSMQNGSVPLTRTMVAELGKFAQLMQLTMPQAAELFAAVMSEPPKKLQAFLDKFPGLDAGIRANLLEMAKFGDVHKTQAEVIEKVLIPAFDKLHTVMQREIEDAKKTIDVFGGAAERGDDVAGIAVEIARAKLEANQKAQREGNIAVNTSLPALKNYTPQTGGGVNEVNRRRNLAQESGEKYDKVQEQIKETEADIKHFDDRLADISHAPTYTHKDGVFIVDETESAKVIDKKVAAQQRLVELKQQEGALSRSQIAEQGNLGARATGNFSEGEARKRRLDAANADIADPNIAPAQKTEALNTSLRLKGDAIDASIRSQIAAIETKKAAEEKGSDASIAALNRELAVYKSHGMEQAVRDTQKRIVEEQKSAADEAEAEAKRAAREELAATIERVNGEVEAIKKGIETKKSALETEVAADRISRSAMLAQLATFSSDAYDRMQDKIQDELDLMGLLPAKRQEIENRLNAIIEDGEKQRSDIIKQQAAEQQRTIDSVSGSISSAFSGQVRGILENTTSASQAMKNVLEDLTVDVIDEIIKIGAKWAVEEAAGVVLHGSAEATKTAATLTGVTTRTAAEQVGLASTGIAWIASALKAIAAGAATTAAGASGFFAPFLGPAAPAAGLGVGASVSAGAASLLAAYELGAWEIPQKQLALLHPGELVMPAQPAEQFRAGAFGGGGGSDNSFRMGDLHVHPPPGQKVDGDKIARDFVRRVKQKGAFASNSDRRLGGR